MELSDKEWDILRCRKELRFPIIPTLDRDSEIAPTEEGTSSESCNYWTIECL